mmetsp:Transcript_39770/g.69861  ORF Transcript_39770/g.69861 Transcript_39770/m.69861 type:complete len:465 (-) Transcript_39770:33-1427(-)
MSRTSGGIRTTSYADAQRLAGARSRDVNVSQIQNPRVDTYNSGSGNMLQKMKESTSEAERLRLKCREAALASAARTQHEEIQRHIDRAKAQAQMNSLHHKEAHEAAMASALALDTGYSSLPNISQEEETAYGAGEVLLPGALEPFEVSLKPVEPQMEEAPATNKARGMTSDDDLSSAGRPPPIDTGAADAPASAPAAAEADPPEEFQEEDFANMDEPIIEEEMEAHLDEHIQDRTSDRSGSGNGSKESSSSQESSSGSYFSDSDSDKWPPSPPVLRFKMRMQFSQRFKPTEGKEMFKQMNEDLEERFSENKSKETVDWGFQYKRALQKNFAVLEMIWAEVNMEKAREFRVGHTTLRLENLSAPSTQLKDKLEFMKMMKRWFDQRIHHAGPYDPMGKRHEFVEQCKTWGHAVKFPPWILYDKEFSPKPMSSADFNAESAAKKEFDSFPEYKRLIWFLGSPEYQTM